MTSFAPSGPRIPETARVSVLYETRGGHSLRTLLAAVAVLSALPAAAETLDVKIRSVLPTAAEDRWNSIPWRMNLFQARLDSQAAGKPILIWVMDGNVLGAT